MTHQSKIQASEASQHVGDGLPPGTPLCNGQYIVDKYLNAGGFGITYLARDSLGRRVVIKECFPNAICCRAGEAVRLRSQTFDVDFSRAVELFQKEARALAHLQHPNIVGVHQIFEANGTAYMALDFVEGTDLFDMIDYSPNALTPEAIRELAVILLQALGYVHRNGILHRDISPDNILLDTMGTPVLIDFGAARQGASQASRVLSRVHTVKDGYSPQEFYIAGSAQSRSSDLYALAATFVHLIEGHPPPNSSLRLAAVAEQKPDPYRPLLGRFPAQDQRLLAAIDRCLNLFAKDRLQSADAWLDALSGRQATAAVAPPAATSTRPPKNDQDDPEIESKIAELVASNHQAIKADSAHATASETQARTTAPDPDSEKRAAERAYWAILNEDPADWAPQTVPEPALASSRIETPTAPIRRQRLFSLSALLPWPSRSARDDIRTNV
ncbi:serine/threonine-protein kinase [Antarctobacter heliothermus]|uniref:Serine/threonine protein kinase n=1 Tax=Antarctobacter heliothermus TaxID=74033 RepID=A0A239IIA1_9RHOB|nr:serine/threonine-protein kinase [Antarctobacter heliothermus]SNS93380.1 Serine/threonine protein kinase [Antarctobacter heliothermus]